MVEVVVVTEEWRPVVGWESIYEVSNLGQLRSRDRFVRCRGGALRRCAGRTTLGSSGEGYRTVSLSQHGETRSAYMHALVARAFLGPRPAGQEVCHWDGDGENNDLSNLRYDTPKGNAGDRVRHGTTNRGERHGHAKLTTEAVRQARRRRAAGETYASLAREAGVETSALRNAVIGVTWGWLE